MPGLISCVIPLDAINICAEIEIVQSAGPVMACEGWVTNHVPAGKEMNGLIGCWLGAVIEKNGVSWSGDVDPESHPMIDICKIVQMERFRDLMVFPGIRRPTCIVPLDRVIIPVNHLKDFCEVPILLDEGDGNEVPTLF